MEFLGDFHFLRPLWLLCLLPALFLVMALWRINETSTAWDRAIDKSLLPWLLDKRKNASERTPLVLLLLVWSATIIALAGPVWERIPQPVQKRQDALVIVLDMSLSMFADDYEPNRLTVAKRKLLDVLEMRPEGQTALVVYAADAHTVTPLTEDTVTISALAPSLSPNIMPAFGSNPASGIQRAITLLTEAGASTGRVLLITDGIENSDVGSIVDLLQETPYVLSVLGIGTPQGAPIPASANDFLRDSSGEVVVAAFDREPLEELADELDGGRYADVELSASDLDNLLTEFNFRNEENLGETGETFDVWADAGPWLLLLVLPLSALVFRRGWVLSVLLGSTLLSGSLLPGRSVQAAEWIDLWKTPDQKAADAFQNDDPTTAAATFESPAWRGAAAYRAGDYETAIQSFQQAEGIDALYNLGNAYARGELLPEALQAYEAVLAQQPDHADALHNKQIVEDLLEEQEQEQQQQQQQQQSEEQQESAQSEPDPNETNPQEEQPEEQGEQSEQESESEPQEQEQQQQNQDRPPDASTEALEDQESLEQWLRRIDDDPGELLQRKFQFEYRRRQLENRAAGNRPVERKIW